jgi:hypothetical protein
VGGAVNLEENIFCKARSNRVRMEAAVRPYLDVNKPRWRLVGAIAFDPGGAKTLCLLRVARCNSTPFCGVLDKALF